MIKYYTKDLIKVLGNKCCYEYEAKVDREISIPEVNRVGLELTGFKKHVEEKRILILGNKELSYIKSMSLEQITSAFEFLFNNETPCLIISRNYPAPPTILRLAQEADVPIIRWADSTSRLMLKLFSLLDDWFAPSTTRHATLLNIYGKGVLIKGVSGIGKSEIALELMKRGHNLVSDDSVDFFRFDHRLVGRAPKITKNMLEIRGLGILDVTKLFGYSIINEEAEIDYIVELVRWDQKASYDRIGNKMLKENILGLDIKKIVLPVSEGRSMADVIEVSVTNFKLIEKGIDVKTEFLERIRTQLEGEN